MHMPGLRQFLGSSALAIPAQPQGLLSCGATHPLPDVPLALADQERPLHVLLHDPPALKGKGALAWQ
jgi:hypothetical protein